MLQALRHEPVPVCPYFLDLTDGELQKMIDFTGDPLFLSIVSHILRRSAMNLLKISAMVCSKICLASYGTKVFRTEILV